MSRVSELRKEGLWSSRRLPKVQEPPRNKAHWDYLLEEMQWLAADFAQERKWKKAAARKVKFLGAGCVCVCGGGGYKEQGSLGLVSTGEHAVVGC